MHIIQKVIQKAGFINHLTVIKGLRVSLYDRLRLMVTPLHQCGDVLNKLVGEGKTVYAGSHHISVIGESGRRVLLLREVGYF